MKRFLQLTLSAALATILLTSAGCALTGQAEDCPELQDEKDIHYDEKCQTEDFREAKRKEAQREAESKREREPG